MTDVIYVNRQSANKSSLHRIGGKNRTGVDITRFTLQSTLSSNKKTYKDWQYCSLLGFWSTSIWLLICSFVVGKSALSAVAQMIRKVRHFRVCTDSRACCWTHSHLPTLDHGWHLEELRTPCIMEERGPRVRWRQLSQLHVWESEFGRNKARGGCSTTSRTG